ncbi:MAG: hypothetical protein AAFX40_07015 [Cyanobacteria bacterium J06639_1]
MSSARALPRWTGINEAIQNWAIASVRLARTAIAAETSTCTANAEYGRVRSPWLTACPVVR